MKQNVPSFRIFVLAYGSRGDIEPLVYVGNKMMISSDLIFKAMIEDENLEFYINLISISDA